MSHRWWTLLVGLLGSLASVSAGQGLVESTFRSAQAFEASTQGNVYRLSAGSLYGEGCVTGSPCTCLIEFTESFRGTFEMRKRASAAMNAMTTSYEIDDVNWLATVSEGERRIVGDGLLEIGSPGPFPVVQARLRMRLRIDDGEFQRYDSGWAPLDGWFDAFSIDLYPVDVGCIGSEFRLDVSVVPGDEVIPYRLGDDALFLEGCFDPCACPISSSDVQGPFGLVRLDPTPASAIYDEWALVNIDWRPPPTPFPVEPFITGQGAGIYRINNASAAPIPPHQLLLDLDINRDDEQPVHFDSGWVVQSEGVGTSPPVIVIDAAQNGFYCFDRVWAVDAAPTP